MKMIGIYKIGNTYTMFPYSISTEKKPIPTDPFIHINVNESNEIIANYILKSFNSIRYDIIHSESTSTNGNRNFLTRLGVKSLLHLHKISSFCIGELKGDTLIFTPSFNNISDRFFSFLNEKKVTVSINGSTDEVGIALNEAFERCE